MPRGFRLIGRMVYFNSITTQNQFQQDLISVSQQRREFDFTIGGNIGRYRLDANLQQYDLFQDVNSVNRSGKRPQVRFSAPDRPIGRSRVYVGSDRRDDSDHPPAGHPLRVPQPQPLALRRSADDPGAAVELAVPVCRHLGVMAPDALDGAPGRDGADAAPDRRADYAAALRSPGRHDRTGLLEGVHPGTRRTATPNGSST